MSSNQSQYDIFILYSSQTSAAYKRLKSQAMGTDTKRDAAVLQLCGEYCSILKC